MRICMAYGSRITELMESREEGLRLPGIFSRIMSGSYTESDRKNFETMAGFLEERGLGDEIGAMVYVCREVISLDMKRV